MNTNLNPYLHRGYKQGLFLKYKDPRHLIILPGSLHLSINNEDNIVYLREEKEIAITYISQWNYHYVYMSIDLDIFYDSEHPKFELERMGYYHRIQTNYRCIGLFFVGDGNIFEFRHANRYEHSFGNFEIFRFNRMYLNISEDNKEFNHLLLDKIELSEPLEHWKFPLYNNYIKFQFRHPNFGTDIENCNLYPKLLINIIANSNEMCSIYSKSLPNDVDNIRHKEPELVKLIDIFSTPLDSYSPNQFYPYTTRPVVKNIAIETNLNGEVYFAANITNTNSVHLSTIGCALPVFLDSNLGVISKDIINSFSGLEIEFNNTNSIKINPGNIYFRFENNIGYNLTKKILILDLTKFKLSSQEKYFIYLNRGDDLEISLDNFECFRQEPKQYGNSNNYYYYDFEKNKFKNKICLGYIYTSVKTILSDSNRVFPIQKYKPDQNPVLISNNDDEIQLLVQMTNNDMENFISYLLEKNKTTLEKIKPLQYISQDIPDYRQLYNNYYNFNWNKVNDITPYFYTDLKFTIPPDQIEGQPTINAPNSADLNNTISLEELPKDTPVTFSIVDGIFTLICPDYYLDDKYRYINRLYLTTKFRSAFDSNLIICDLSPNLFTTKKYQYVPCEIFEFLERRYNPFDLLDIYFDSSYLLSRGFTTAKIVDDLKINSYINIIDININEKRTQINFLIYSYSNNELIKSYHPSNFYLFEDNIRVHNLEFNSFYDEYIFEFDSIHLDGKVHNLKLFSINDYRAVINFNYTTFEIPELCNIK
jgi:hypothetical protein